MSELKTATASRLRCGPSTVAGEGAFCTEPIARGEIVARALVGRPVPRAAYAQIDWSAYRGRIMQIEENWFLEGTGEVVDYINHSCDPNVGFDASGENFIALRTLAAAEEVFFHYSTCEDHADWSMPCGCGSTFCRGEITGFRDLPAHDKRRLLPIALPYLRRLYAAFLSGDGYREHAYLPGSDDRPA